MGKLIDMTGWVMKEHGQPESHLTIIERVENNRERRAQWKCRCDCGNEFITVGHDIRRGHTKSCGCYQKERVAETKRAIKKDLTGQIFGKLTVLSCKEKLYDRDYYWKCQCECGNIISVRGSHLISGHTKSCGCLSSKGELKISKLLRENNIKFISQYIDKNLKDKAPLRFDFAIFNDDDELVCIIEYQGSQHYNDEGFMGSSPKEHDQMKRDYCKKHNIKLIEIPYWDYNQLDYQYIIDKIKQI